MMASAPLLKVSNLSVQYRVGHSGVRALDDVSLEVPDSGYTLGVVGESGSGKTTLGLSIMNMVEAPGEIAGGKVEYRGRDVLKLGKSDLRSYRWKEVAMVYQSAMNSLNPVKPVCHPIVEVIRQHTGAGKAEATERALSLLSEVGIDQSRAYDYPFQLSGGMRQRVTIALALALNPKLLVADETTSALDVVVQKQILRLLKQEVVKQGLALVFVTHEIAILPEVVENVAVMHRGEVVEIGALAKVLKEPLHPYTEMLLNSLLTIDYEGDLGDGSSQTEGEQRTVMALNACRYSNRCKYAFDRCRNERPVLREVEKGRWVSCLKY